MEESQIPAIKTFDKLVPWKIICGTVSWMLIELPPFSQEWISVLRQTDIDTYVKYGNNTQSHTERSMV